MSGRDILNGTAEDAHLHIAIIQNHLASCVTLVPPNRVPPGGHFGVRKFWKSRCLHCENIYPHTAGHLLEPPKISRNRHLRLCLQQKSGRHKMHKVIVVHARGITSAGRDPKQGSSLWQSV